MYNDKAWKELCSLSWLSNIVLFTVISTGLQYLAYMTTDILTSYIHHVLYKVTKHNWMNNKIKYFLFVYLISPGHVTLGCVPRDQPTCYYHDEEQCLTAQSHLPHYLTTEHSLCPGLYVPLLKTKQYYDIYEYSSCNTLLYIM